MTSSTTSSAPLPVDPQRLWLIYGQYYDLESFLDTHPGGRMNLSLARGQDCTILFESHHLYTGKATAALRPFWVGSVADYAPDIAGQYLLAPDGFYRTLKRRVVTHLTTMTYVLKPCMMTRAKRTLVQIASGCQQ